MFMRNKMFMRKYNETNIKGSQNKLIKSQRVYVLEYLNLS